MEAERNIKRAVQTIDDLSHANGVLCALDHPRPSDQKKIPRADPDAFDLESSCQGKMLTAEYAEIAEESEKESSRFSAYSAISAVKFIFFPPSPADGTSPLLRRPSPRAVSARAHTMT